MPNRRLTDAERESHFMPLIATVRSLLLEAAAGDPNLHWALRRKLAKELVYDERSKPMDRKILKRKKRAEQQGLCAGCKTALPDRGAVLDRFEAMLGYTASNTQLLCLSCDVEKQRRLGYS